MRSLLRGAGARSRHDQGPAAHGWRPRRLAGVPGSTPSGDFLHDWAWAEVAAFDGQPQRRFVAEEDGQAGGDRRCPGAPAAPGAQLLVRPARAGARLRPLAGGRRLRAVAIGLREAAPPRPRHRRQAGATAGAREPAGRAFRRLRHEPRRCRSGRRAWSSWPMTKRCWPPSTRTRATPCAAPSARA